MTKTEFFQQMEDMQKEIDAIRIKLQLHISDMMKGKGSVAFEDDQPFIYHDGDGICIENLIDSVTAFGTGQDGVKYELDIAELSTDDIKMIAERLAQEVL